MFKIIKKTYKMEIHDNNNKKAEDEEEDDEQCIVYHDNDEDINDDDDDIHYPRYFDIFLNNTFNNNNNNNTNNNNNGNFDIIGSKHFFEPWPFEEIWNNNKIWKFNKKYIHLYVLSNKCKEKNLHSHVGCVNDVKHRFFQHNGKIPGGPTETRKGAGDWRIVIIVRFPPIRNYDIKDIRNICRSKRGPMNRYEIVLKIAQEKGLEYFISKELTNDKSPFFIKEIYDYILHLKQNGRFSYERNVLPIEFDTIQTEMDQLKTRKRKKQIIMEQEKKKKEAEEEQQQQLLLLQQQQQQQQIY